MDKNEAQLELIRELFAECESRNLRIWLLGGWGIDALLGRISREHHDIDILAEDGSKEALRVAIGQIGGEFADKPVGWRFWKNDVRVDVTFILYAADGTPISDLKKEDPNVYPWPPGSFPDECNGRLPGLSCRAISWEAQYVAKAGYKDVFPDTALRSKDDLDLETIRRHVPLEKRKELKERWFGGIPKDSVSIPKHVDIIFLNGPSSAGKSTVAEALQRRLKGTWLHVSLDTLFHLLPKSYFEDPTWGDRMNWDCFLTAFHSIVAELPKTGFPLILDHVCTSRRWLDQCAQTLQGYRVLCIGVTCPLDELRRRERARGDRKIGIAEEHLATYQDAGPFDVEVNTQTCTPDECADQIIAVMSHPTAFNLIRSATLKPTTDNL